MVDGKDVPMMDEPSNIDPITQRLIDILPDADNSQAQIQELASEFINKWGAPGRIDHDGLTAHLFLSLYGSKLTADQSKMLQHFRFQARASSKLVNQTLDRVQFLEQDSRDYFRHRVGPYAFTQVPLSPSMLANTVLTLEASRISSALTRELQTKEKNLVVHPYVYPEVNPKNAGVWVSHSGLQFDPQKLPPV